MSKGSKRKIEHWQVVRLLLMVYDFAAVIVSFGVALWLRFDCKVTSVEPQYLTTYTKTIIIYALFCLVVFWFLRLYKSIWRFASYSELLRVILATVVTGVIYTGSLLVFNLHMPVSYYVIGITVQFIATLGIRFFYRFVLLLRGRTNNEVQKKNVMIIGAGSAGFIGSNLVLELLKTQSPIHIIGLDNMNDYYDVSIKEWRLEEIEKCLKEHSDSSYVFYKDDLANKAIIDHIFEEHKPDIVVNLGAQAGVRYSISNPDAYIQSNMIGFYNILEACRHSYDNGAKGVEHLVYASSSSVYGTNKKVPYSTEDKVDNPVSLYAATKKSNELMAHAYSKLYNIPSTGLRFFTVYGPAGRPDMAYFGFTNKLLKGDTIQIFNYGNCKRDFTYVDDIVEGVKRIMQGAPEKKNGEDGLPIPPYAVYNIGNSNPENLLDFVTILQEELIRAEVLPADYDFEAHKKLVPMQPGDVPITYADTSALERDYGFKPNTSLRDGLRKFAEWYKEFYKI